MEDYSETSLHGSLDELDEESGQISTQELDDYLQIFTKPEEARQPQEVHKLIAKIIDLNIFNKSLLENMDPKLIVAKLIPFFKYEHFPAGSPIFHYEQPADKLFIILRGKAREFVPKDLDTIEKESRSNYRSDPISKDIILSMPDLPNPATITSLEDLPEGPLRSLEAIYEEEPEDKDLPATEAAKKKFRKMKALLPFLKKMIAQKTATQRIIDYGYKQSLRKPRKMPQTQEYCGDISPQSLGPNMDAEILEEFKKFPKAYFIGGVLKVQFSKYLYAGDYCGARALKDNALRNLAIIADEDCECISLDRDDYLSVLEQEKSLNADKIEFFTKLFDKFNEERITKFALLWEHQTLQAGEVVFQQNESPEHLYALFKGEIMLSKTAPNLVKSKNGLKEELPFRIKKKQDQNEVRVATICSRDFFGDADFFQGTNREFTATVKSIRAKIFRLSLEKYKEAYRAYHDIFKEIKVMTNLKFKWNKERFEGLSHQQSLGHTLNQNQNAYSEKERALHELGQFFPISSNARLSVIEDIDKSKQSPEYQRGDSISRQSIVQQSTFLPEHQPRIEVKSCAFLDEKGKFFSPKAGSFASIDFKPVIKPSHTVESFGKLPLKPAENKLNSALGDIEEDSSLQMFSRAKLPREYTSKHDEILKKQKEISNDSLDFFGHKKPNHRKRQSQDTSLSTTSTRGTSIQFLKRKIFEGKPNEIVDIRLSQKMPSIELDTRPQSQVFSLSNSVAVNPSLSSIADNSKTLQKSLIGPAISQRHRRTKPHSVDKNNNVLTETSGNAPKKSSVNLYIGKSIDQPAKNDIPTYYLASPMTRGSLRSRQRDSSKSISHLQLFSPKAGEIDLEKETFKGFRIVGSKASPENLRLSMVKARGSKGGH